MCKRFVEKWVQFDERFSVNNPNSDFDGLKNFNWFPLRCISIWERGAVFGRTCSSMNCFLKERSSRDESRGFPAVFGRQCASKVLKVLKVPSRTYVWTPNCGLQTVETLKFRFIIHSISFLRTLLLIRALFSLHTKILLCWYRSFFPARFLWFLLQAKTLLQQFFYQCGLHSSAHRVSLCRSAECCRTNSFDMKISPFRSPNSMNEKRADITSADCVWLNPVFSKTSVRSAPYRSGARRDRPERIAHTEFEIRHERS